MPVDPGAIIDFLQRAASPLDAAALAAGLGVPRHHFGELREQLRELEEAGLLFRVEGQRYATPEGADLVVGRVSGSTRQGAGFVAVEGSGPDIFVPAHAMESAQHGDRVAVRTEPARSGEGLQGRVVQVLARARTTVVGTFRQRRAGRWTPGYVVPVGRQVRSEVEVGAGRSGEAQDGQVVVVRVTDWGDARRPPAGEVVRVLGSPEDAGVAMEALIQQYELPTAFPVEVEAAAAAIGARGIVAEDLHDREDLRDLPVFTIDPADARDHDDALSLRPLAAGRWEVGVHIADVSHYVREGSPLDLEALARGTSVYLVDRVLPMLPHALSSDLCSLRPDQDRLALSLLLVLDEEAVVHEHRLVRSVIRSRHRLAYEQAQAALEGGASLPAPAVAALRQLLALSQALRRRRRARGSLDLDQPEARVVLDAGGLPTEIRPVERLETHRLVEDFMLLANETIAERAAAARIPFIFRVHERPEPAKLEQLGAFLATLGYRLGDGSPHDLQRVLEQAAGRPDQALLSTVLLRALKQARYAAANLGHFGLAARHYTHFTSPIRRYPDLMVHRLCARVFLEGGRAGVDSAALEEVARQSSERERLAAAAERDSVDLKKLEYMERHIGEAFDGVISNVRGFGFFVLLDAFFVEGLVHVSSLPDDYYLYVEDEYALAGERSHRRFRLGDRLKVRVEAVDREERRLELVVAERPARRGGRTARKRT